MEEVALFFGYPGDSNVDPKRRRCDRHGEGSSPVHPKPGVG